MRYIANIVIGKPLIDVIHLISDGSVEDDRLEREQTFFTQERNIAKILNEIGAVKSVSEVKRNKAELFKDFTELDCFWLKWGKKRFYVIVGE